MLAVALSACGGGGGGGTSSGTPDAKTTPDPATWLSCPASLSTTVGQSVTASCQLLQSGLSVAGQWSQLDGPVSASLSSSTPLSVTVDAARAGEYRFQLLSTAGGLERRDTVALQVAPPPNTAPRLSCPSQVQAVAGQEVVLTCTASDDGLPAGSTLTTAWRVASSPVAVALAGADTLSARFVPSKAGSYRLQFEASDGQLASTADVAVEVALPPNTPPSITCPATVDGITGQDVAISCAASDDGQPEPAKLTPSWTLVSGSGPATLTGQTSFNARLVSAVAGTYRLRLQVSDGALASSSDVVVTLAPPPNLAPTVVCPASVSGRTSQDVAIGCSATDDGQPAGSVLSASWTVVSGPAPLQLKTGSGPFATTFTTTTPGSYRLRLSVSDGARTTSADVVADVSLPPNQAPRPSCPASLVGTTGQLLQIGCTVLDDGQPAGQLLTPTWSQVSGPASLSLAGAGTLTTSFTPAQAGTYVLRLSVSDSLLTGTADVTVTVNLPPNTAPVVTCPATLNGTSRQEVVITCTARDDGQPIGGTLKPTWTARSGPGTLTLIGADTFSVRFTPTVTGNYVLRFAVSDGALSSSADVTVTVVPPPNAAPQVTCPSQVNGVVGQEVSLGCSATDDGEPFGSVLSGSWTRLSGPASPTVSDADTLTARFTPSVSGTYRYRLSVTDSQLTTTADVTVTVNAPPVVNCPATQTGLTGSDVSIACTATDDGLPAGSVLNYRWTVASGPATPTLTGQTTTTVTFRPTVAGVYGLRLTASDGSLSTAVITQVTVAVPNVAPTVSCPASATGTVGSAVTLSCTVTDDGQPTANPPALSWTRVSAPVATIAFSAPSASTTSFTPTVAGTYQVRLTANDGLLSSAADITVTVSPPTNVAPTLSCPTAVSGVAGRALSVTCTVSDDGLPTGSTVSLTGTWVSGPASPTLTVSGSTLQTTTPTAGAYRLRVTASDTLLTKTADIDVNVLAATTWRIQPLGASIVNGYAGQRSFRYPLWTKLIDSGAKFDMVGSSNTTVGGTPTFPDYKGQTFDREHEGHSGYTAGQVAAGLPGWMVSYAPDMSLIHVGTNDLIQQGANGITPAINGLTSIVQALRAKNPSVRIWVSKLIPVDPYRSDSIVLGQTQLPQNIIDLNNRLDAWAAGLTQTGSPIRIVDNYTGFNATTDTVDGVHPNALGEEKMATGFFAAIAGQL